MATTETEADGNTEFLGSTHGTALLHSVGSRPANAQLPPDPGGVLRRVNYSVGGLKTFAVVGAEVADGRRVNPREFEGGAAWIDYYGPEGTLPKKSFSTVYLGHVPRGFFHDKIVVVGPSAPSLQDVHPTSTAPKMPGAEVQASAIETVLRGLPLRSSAAWLDLALIVLLGCATPLATLRFGSIATVALALALAVVFTVAVQIAFNNGRVVSFVYPLGALILSAAGALSVQLVTVAFERERVRDLFSRFVPENVVDEVLASTDAGLRLGGVQREGTVMFTDLRGFTTFAETLTPDRVIEVLNHYLSEMSDAILDHGGTLVAYMGDGIMAVFGAPIAQDDHADRALSSAREMLTVRLARFNEWLRSQELSTGFRMGIGLNSGRVMSGNVGSERRVEYTAVGDATNVAARIEQYTKGTPHQLLLSGTTKDVAHRAARGPRVRRRDRAARPAGSTRCYGRSRTTGQAEATRGRRPLSPRPTAQVPPAAQPDSRDHAGRSAETLRPDNASVSPNGVTGLAQSGKRARSTDAVGAERVLRLRVGGFVSGSRGRGQRGVVATDGRQRSGEARVDSAHRGSSRSAAPSALAAEL